MRVTRMFAVLAVFLIALAADRAMAAMVTIAAQERPLMAELVGDTITLPDTDRRAIRDVIERQLQAFLRDDGTAAFSYASPHIQGIFQTPENFMAMVKNGYQPVYRPQAVTFRDIIDALSRPGRDPRADAPGPIFKKGVLKLEDLSEGMELRGTVLNVVDFGVFVDIGLKDSGLVHISQMSTRFIRSPHEVASVGDVVTVWVLGIDQERRRVSLTMVPPGTPREATQA